MLSAPRKLLLVVDELYGLRENILVGSAFKEQLVKLSVLPMAAPSTADMQTFVKSEIVRWGKVAQQAGIARSE